MFFLGHKLAASLLLLVFLAIMYLIPKIRKSGGNWATARKAVPPGCLVSIIFSALLWGGWMFLNNRFGPFPVSRIAVLFLSLAILSAGLCAGLVAMILIASRLRRKFPQQPERKSNLPCFFLYLKLGIICFLFVFLIPFLYEIFSGSHHGNWRTGRIQEERHTSLAFQERSIHPFLAEYEYRLCFRCGGKEVYRRLMVNSGGRTYFNIYRMKDGRIFFTDKDFDYIVDLRKQEVLLVLTHKEKRYAVLLPNEEVGSWSVSAIDDAVCFRFNEKPCKALPLSNELDGKVYLGCFTTAFHSAEEKPEQPIEKLRKL